MQRDHARAVVRGMRSDLLKIRSTQVWFWMLVLAIVVTALSTIGSVLGETEGPNGVIYNPDYYNIFTASQQATLELLVLGLLGLTTEFRHQTITATLLAIPNRWRIIGAKTLMTLSRLAGPGFPGLVGPWGGLAD